MKTPIHKTISQLPASRFPEPAELYFCDRCGRDLTKNLYHDRAPVWQPLRPMWFVCPCGQKYLSGAAEWDDLTTWERRQRVWQLRIGFALFALLVTPATLAYFALRYGGAALIALVGIALIPSILVARPFGFVLLDLYEIVASVWRTRLSRRASPVTPIATTIKRWIRCSHLREYRLSPIAAVIAVVIIATRWIPSHAGATSPVSALSSPERANAAQQEILFAPAKLPVSPIAQVAIPGAPSPAFRRVRVGPNEVDYIAEDVTVRHFLPTFARPRAQAAYKEVHIGPDVTIRYFASKPEIAPGTRPVSADSSPPLSN
jgi:hypothetical protein